MTKVAPTGRQIKPGMQYGAILSLISREDDGIDIYDITAFLPMLSEQTVAKRFRELADFKIIEQCKRGEGVAYRFTSEFDAFATNMLERVIFAAGPEGISKEQAAENFNRRMFDFGINISKVGLQSARILALA